MKICQYLRLHMKIICRRFHIKTTSPFWDMCTWDIRKVCLQTFRNNRIRCKLAYVFKKFTNFMGKNSSILRIKKAKFLGYCFIRILKRAPLHAFSWEGLVMFFRMLFLESLQNVQLIMNIGNFLSSSLNRKWKWNNKKKWVNTWKAEVF